MRLPHHKYAEYLFSTGAVGSDVNDILQQGNFPLMDEEQMLKYQREYTFIPQNSVEFEARRRGIYFLYNRTDPVKEAFATLYAPYRHMLEVLLTGRVPTWDIISLANDRYGVTPTEEGIRAYAQYFWDLQGFTSDSFFKYTQAYKTVTAEGRDLWVAWEQGPSAAMSRMGRTGNIDTTAAMEDVFESAYMNYVSVAREDPLCDDVAKNAVRWAKVMFDAHAIRSAGGMNLSVILAAIEKFVIRNDPSGLQKLLRQTSPGSDIEGMNGEALYDGDPRDVSIEQLAAISNIMAERSEDE